jgi:hypothetical protein
MRAPWLAEQLRDEALDARAGHDEEKLFKALQKLQELASRLGRTLTSRICSKSQRLNASKPS